MAIPAPMGRLMVNQVPENEGGRGIPTAGGGNPPPVWKRIAPRRMDTGTIEPKDELPFPVSMRLRALIFLFLLFFGLTPLVLAVMINLPLVLNRITLFYQKAYLQNLRADFRDLDEHLASRHEMIRLLAKLPEPGVILGEQGDAHRIDLARARYTEWINQILNDQRDIVHILFFDARGHERFWLERDPKTLQWHPTLEPPEHPNPEFLQAALGMQPGGVMVSRIRVESTGSPEGPRQQMMLSLVSTIGNEETQRPKGLVVLTIDVGGLAQFYRDTLWVNHNGSYLRPGQPVSEAPEAFRDFPGLREIFSRNTLALWKGEEGEQFLWVPMFITENAEPLWVGRRVDSSPIDTFRNALIFRVVGIVLLLLLVIMGVAQWIARRIEHFGKELTQGIRRVVRDGESIQFAWQGPQELRELGEQLTALANQHIEHLRADREHTRALERSNRYKSEFLANVSHELRTPLNSILLLSKMLADTNSGLSPNQRRQVQVIYEASRDLQTMIDNILDISRIEAGRVRIQLEWLPLQSLVEDLLEVVLPLFEEKGLAVQMRTDPEAPKRIYSDRDKVRQILKNFLSNAAKFTDRGSVTVKIERGEGAYGVALSVEDTGIGIPEDQREIIFEAFQQVDGSTHRRYGGTGLGLSISRDLAELLGGTIQVTSREGQGSRFTLSLPLEFQAQDRDPNWIIQENPSPPQAQDATVVEVPTEERLFGSHWVLLVERDVTGLLEETRLLEALGFQVQTAADGEESLETLQEDSGCALLFLAEGPSVEATCDTIRLIREGTAIPIVLFVRAPEDEGRNPYLEAGADALVPKPVVRAQLETVLKRILQPESGLSNP